MTNWIGRRVLILGAARQGQALARWLARHGARVTLNDLRPLDDMRAVQASLSDVDVEWVLGGHPLELLERVDLVCPSGGVPLTLPIVAEALKRGIPFSNDTQIFLEAAPCKTIGITGSAGKTTTTTLVGEMAKLAMSQKAESGKQNAEEGRSMAKESAFRVLPSVFVGGNIGDPLINYVDEMKPDDLAILEISSFQLDQMTTSTTIAAILNITPNHLDRHGTMEAYTAAKARLLDSQAKDSAAILGRDDPGSWGLRERVHGKLYGFSLSPLDEGLDGSYFDDGLLALRDGFAYTPLLLREKIQLRGDHNVSNVLAAFAIGHAADFPLDAMLTAADEFRGVPHRLELIREWNGARWYNDSIATAPERTMAAIRSFDEPIILLLGGRDKNLPWKDLAELVHERVEHVVLFGEAAPLIEAALGPTSGKTRTQVRCAGLREAVDRAAQVAESGMVVLLSPGGTSFDEFTDFAERGERFRTWVQELS
ncbi:MAG: UDP-N-acetylmuramoyl-L-alanine--D-glutamate ligase [Anaerolineaceae bacterium]|nr:MAG: UDP-N-acetylmuramoyl-L-alanine--D-glutamate ligase [Anaerolineaceae bacterium]